MIRSIGIGAIVTACLALGALGCKGPHKYQGSCDMRGGASSSTDSAICIDVYTAKNLDAVKAICSNYTWQQTACDRKAALGGCRDDNEIEWHYKSGTASTSADVQKGCSSDMKFVGNDWVEQEKP
jgi:hypothetical protein